MLRRQLLAAHAELARVGDIAAGQMVSSELAVQRPRSGSASLRRCVADIQLSRVRRQRLVVVTGIGWRR